MGRGGGGVNPVKKQEKVNFTRVCWSMRIDDGG